MESNRIKRPRGLGRGLEALLGGDSPLNAERTASAANFSASVPDLPSAGLPSDAAASPSVPSVPVPEDTMPICRLRVSDIEPNPHQPRKNFDEAALQTLAESIRDHGLLQPLIVRRRLDENGDPVENSYQLIAGERRWRACRRAGLSEAPAILMEADDLRMTELALIENLQREDLNPLEEARSYQMLMTEFGLSQSEAAARVGRSRPAVANSVRLLALPEAIQDYVVSGTLSAGHARALLVVEDEEDCKRLAERVIREDLNVRQTEKLAAAWKARREQTEQPEPAEQPITEADVDHFAAIRKELSGLWGRKVDFREKNGKRYITMEYYDAEDLEGLIESLSRFKP